MNRIRLAACSSALMAAALFLSCATVDQSVKMTSTKADESLAGVWIDAETRCSHTIVKTDAGYSVTGVEEEDTTDKIELLSSEWKDGVLTWQYFVPQTGYTVTMRTERLDGGRIEIGWNNDDGKGGANEGKEILYRKDTIPGNEGEPDDGAVGK